MEVGPMASASGLWGVTDKKLDGWIMDNLQPSEEFSRQVKETVKQICEFLKQQDFEKNIRVQKTVKGGSTGKGTALKNNSDADVVLFINYFSSYEKQKQDKERLYILKLIEERLHICRDRVDFTVSISKPWYKRPSNAPRSLSFSLCSKNSESTEVDLLPAYDALGPVIKDVPPDTNVFVKLLNACSSPGEFSPCFTELQKKFVKRCPPKLKNLVRLVKYWYKELVKAEHPNADLPPKYALELLTIYAWEVGTNSNKNFVTAEGFRTVLELLRQHQEICIYWEEFYSLQNRQIGDHVKRLLGSCRPVILDPADPTGILGQGKRWDLLEKAAASHLAQLPCIKNIRAWVVEPARPVEIVVKQLTGTRLSKTISPSTTIWQLKEEVEKVWGIPWYQQRLAMQEPLRGNGVLQNHGTLASHGIFYNTTLTLLQTDPQEMEVFVQDNKTTTYRVQPTLTVRQLKEMIHRQHGPAPDQQRLIYNCTDMQDKYTLAYYKVHPRSTIQLVGRLRGGAGPRHPQFPACSPS
ncbi:2'-5'-oligoadenylate synthase 1 [Calypte anna]|uniref:2'-5'-oligoadenylate synthase 1 n=1 Tax=Calypte anna TaxID=9244 RepID=UPI0011C37EBF|nr:2'-5'-oligoadenylate synthase 1 [Calypte anna]